MILEGKNKKEKVLKTLIIIGIATISLSLGFKYFESSNVEISKQNEDRARAEISNSANFKPKLNELAGYWSFDESKNNTTKDLSGNNNDGTLINAPKSVFGKIGQAYLFNGKNESIEIKNSEKINPEKAITIEAWVKPLDSTQRIMGKYNADSSGGWYFWFSPERKFVFSTTDGSQYASVKSKKSYETAEWSHIAGEYDNETKILSLFVNGEKAGETTLLKGIIQSSNNLTIGKFTDGGDGFFKGAIDEVRLYNRILNEKEIQESYSSTL